MHGNAQPQSDCCANRLLDKDADRYGHSKKLISTVMGNSGDKGGFSVFIRHTRFNCWVIILLFYILLLLLLLLLSIFFFLSIHPVDEICTNRSRNNYMSGFSSATTKSLAKDWAETLQRDIQALNRAPSVIITIINGCRQPLHQT